MNVRTVADYDADLEMLRHELICAEDCPEHRAVAEIRAEIAVTREHRDILIPTQHKP